MCAVTLLALACGAFGCANSHVSQILWHEHMAWITSCVGRGNAQGIKFSPSQLRIMAGDPDCALTVQEFVWRARGDPTELWQQLTQSTTPAEPSKAGGVRMNTSIKNIGHFMLWAYDERRRFSHALPSCTGLPDQYSCYVVIIGDDVVSVKQLWNWKGLRD